MRILSINYNYNYKPSKFKRNNFKKEVNVQNDNQKYNNPFLNYPNHLINFLGEKTAVSKNELETYIKENPKASQAEIAVYFIVSKETIRRLIDKYKINYESKQMNKGPSIPKDKLEQYILDNPDLSMNKIAWHFDVTSETIRTLINRYGINYERKLSAQEPSISKDKLEQYILDNPDLTTTEIAQHFHVAASTVRNLINRYGIDYEKKPAKQGLSISKDELKQYVLEHPDLTTVEIAKHFYVSSQTISNLINRYGIDYKRKRHKRV